MLTITTRPKTQLGFTLVQLMVAITLGLLITAGVGFIYLQGIRSHAQDDRYARMQEHARYALHVIADDLKMADFWGEMLAPGSITTALVPGEDCQIGLASGTNALLYNNASPATTLFDVALNGCPGLTGTIRPQTDVLAIKRVSGTPLTAGQTDGIVYLRTNATVGTFIDDAGTTAPPPGFQDWQYIPRLYYIRNDAIPALCRLDLSGLAFAAVPADGCLAEGVEQFHIQFGIDTDNDGLANRYLSNPTAAQAATAVSARIYVLVRTAEQDRDYTNTKTYQLGDLAIDPTPNDNFYRRVFSTTVSLRNPSSIIVLNNS